MKAEDCQPGEIVFVSDPRSDHSIAARVIGIRGRNVWVLAAKWVNPLGYDVSQVKKAAK
jgi:hypothetical protein